MPTEQIALRLVHAAYAAKSIKTALFPVFMDFSHYYNAYFPWHGAPRQRKVQGFCEIMHITLALKQSRCIIYAFSRENPLKDKLADGNVFFGRGFFRSCSVVKSI